LKAYIKTKYGGPEILQLEEVENPSLKDDHILVKVMANSANPADRHILRGKPIFVRFSFGLFKPKDKILGTNFASRKAVRISLRTPHYAYEHII